MTTDPQTFGQRLARRVASPVLTHALGMRYMTVGAVGRASLGFSRAVGRSQSIRPVVNGEELNSYALRPPAGFWGHDDVEVQRSYEPTEAAPPAKPLVSRRPAASAMTWTDRMLPKGGTFGAVPAVQRTASQAAPAPSGLPTDSKFERMRKIFDVSTGRAPKSDARPEPDRAIVRGESNRVLRPTAEESNDVGAFGGSRGDTTAGPRTGPGRLAESMRPEVHDGSAVLLPGRSDRTRTDPSQTPSRPPSPGLRSSPSSRRPAQGGSPRGRPAPSGAGPGDKLDTIRRLMGELGTSALSKSDETGDESPGAGPSAGRSAGRPAKHERATRPGRSPEQPRTARVDQQPPNEVRRQVPGNTVRAPIERATRPGRSPEQPRTARVDQQPPNEVRRQVPGNAVRAPIERRSATDGPQRGSPSAAVDPVPTSPTAVDPIAATARLRASRTISRRTSFVEGHEHLLRENTATGPDPRPEITLPSTVEPSDTVVGSQRDVPGTQLLVAPPATRPLPRLGGSLRLGSDDLVRRVSLPRVLSAQHRPISAAVHASPGSPTSRRSGQHRIMTDPARAEAATSAVRETGRLDARLPTARVAPDQLSVRNDSIDAIVASRTLMSSANRDRTVAEQQPGLQWEPSLSPSSLASVVGRDTVQQPIRPTASAAMPPDRVRRSIVAPGSGALVAALRQPASPIAQARTDQSRRESSSRPHTIRRATAGGEQAPDYSRPSVDLAASTKSVQPAPRPPAADLGDRFLSELSETIQRRPAPLPMQFRPMADAIAGKRSVMLSSDDASRRALRSVGKVAATVSDVIHFDPGQVPGNRVSEVIAHELTHIAHPSPQPRFFDDTDDSPEERQAEQVAKTMARSPLNPSASLLTPPKVGTSAPAQRSTVRRSLIGGLAGSLVGSARSALTPSTDAASGTVSAAALAAQMTGVPDVAQQGAESVQAALSMEGLAPALDELAGVGDQLQSIRDEVSSLKDDFGGEDAPSESPMFDTPAADEWFKQQLRDNFSHIMNMIEDRMIEELDRRGGRIWGGL